MDSKPKLRAVVSHDLCVGVAMCLQSAPGAFQLDAARQSVFKPGGQWTDDELQEAADGCPMGAIQLIEIDSQSGS